MSSSPRHFRRSPKREVLHEVDTNPVTVKSRGQDSLENAKYYATSPFPTTESQIFRPRGRSNSPSDPFESARGRSNSRAVVREAASQPRAPLQDQPPLQLQPLLAEPWSIRSIPHGDSQGVDRLEISDSKGHERSISGDTIELPNVPPRKPTNVKIQTPRGASHSLNSDSPDSQTSATSSGTVIRKLIGPQEPSDGNPLTPQRLSYLSTREYTTPKPHSPVSPRSAKFESPRSGIGNLPEKAKRETALRSNPPDPFQSPRHETSRSTSFVRVGSSSGALGQSNSRAASGSTIRVVSQEIKSLPRVEPRRRGYSAPIDTIAERPESSRRTTSGLGPVARGSLVWDSIPSWAR